ncbi:MAG: cytochrome c oxidase subunit I [Actinobacteria bacterium]|nr:cytochrome c oxidase subunit I [Actinomycetota bacterium]
MATTTVASPRTFQGTAWTWITTVDHKRIAALYLVTSLLFFGLGGVEALIMRLQLARPENALVESGRFAELFTMHGTTMVFLALMPLSAAFFNLLVPLMIGARDVAFPRLNALSYWVYLFGGVFLNISFLAGGAPDAGWFGYAPLTSTGFAGSRGIDFWIFGLQILGVSSILASINFITTIINLRAPGMSLRRMPLFVWMTLVTGFLIIFAFPVITVGLILLAFDRYLGTSFFLPAGGGDPVLWQHLFWVFGHPEVYILILPAMGIVSEVLPTFARKPLFGYAVVTYSGASIALLGFGVWTHHMFTVGLGPIADTAFAASTMLIAVPTGVKIFNWIATLWGGSISFRTPLWFAVGMVAMFIMGGLTGVSLGSPPVDTQVQDTYYVVGHLHYVLFGGSVLGLFAGIYYWFPKFTGRLLHEGWGKAHFVLMLVGMNLTFLPMHNLGIDGMPRRIYTYPTGMGWDLWNMVATVGAFLIAFSLLIFTINAVQSIRRGRVAGNDPWDGGTLEWTTTSPPPVYNFAEIPTVASVYPAWDLKRGAGHTCATVTVPAYGDDNGRTEPLVHMPNPSYWPIVFAAGLVLAFCGLVFHQIFILVGAVTMGVALFGWIEEPAA